MEGAPLGLRGLEGSQGGDEKSGTGQVPADVSHPACTRGVLGGQCFPSSLQATRAAVL